MPFLMSFALEPEIVTFAWIDNASVQFPLNNYATKGFMVRCDDWVLGLEKANSPGASTGARSPEVVPG
jgi:hypothetical protein